MKPCKKGQVSVSWLNFDPKFFPFNWRSSRSWSSTNTLNLFSAFFLRVSSTAWQRCSFTFVLLRSFESPLKASVMQVTCFPKANSIFPLGISVSSTLKWTGVESNWHPANMAKNWLQVCPAGLHVSFSVISFQIFCQCSFCALEFCTLSSRNCVLSLNSSNLLVLLACRSATFSWAVVEEDLRTMREPNVF